MYVVVVSILELLKASIPLVGVAPVAVVLLPFTWLAAIGVLVGKHRMLCYRYCVCTMCVLCV